MTLSIIIPTHDDTRELIQTVASIRRTASHHPEIIIVDDWSATPVHHYAKSLDGCKIIANRFRLGVGASRHIGAVHASGDVLLFIDSHMRFLPGWFEDAMRRVDGRPRTLHCATCLGLDDHHMDPEHPIAEYHGATLNVCGPDPQRPSQHQVMEVVWALNDGRTEIREDDCELAACMGAAYFMPRKWYLELSPLKHLRGWGGDEQALSLSAWLSGGDVRLMKHVRIGHRFGSGRVGMWQQFGVDPKWVVVNKILVIRTMLPLDDGGALEKVLETRPSPPDAFRIVSDMVHVIETDRAEFMARAKRDFRWYCNKFNLPNWH